MPYKAREGAAVDLIATPTNFLLCTSGEYALCYYSGADPLPCTVDESRANAGCVCQVFAASEAKPMYVDINSILDECAYDEAIEQCGEDGSGCLNICSQPAAKKACGGVSSSSDLPEAYVCGYIASDQFDESADYVSTFSFATVAVPKSGAEFAPPTCNRGLGQYAGCMTASCTGSRSDDNGNTYTSCACPLWPTDGSQHRYQYGRVCVDGSDRMSPANCTLSDGQAWSAAFNPLGCGPPDGDPGS
ncbi:MAG: hypothetical protein MPN21_17525 [Thermoanaerobaculia bacterium]|nr:hypothetical protein [Thermoanaerobaculia bacterium]